MNLTGLSHAFSPGRLLNHLRDLCYPGVCPLCQSFHDRSSGSSFCSACDDRLSSLSAEPACSRCAKPIALPDAPCPWCLGKGIYPYQFIARLGEFTEPLRTLIHQAKYVGRWSMAEILADRLAIRSLVRELLSGCDCLVPVPLHFRRQFWRGYNQSEVLAKRLGELRQVRVVHALRRIRDTATQTRLTSRKARHDNMKGAFVLKDERLVHGRHVVVVDDVTTSGATLQEAGRAIRAAKPASLSAIVLAVADPRRRDFQAI